MEKSFMNRYRLAMNYGTSMGIFWIAKFALVPLGLSYQFLQLLFLVLTVAVPILGYRFAKQCRDRYCGGTMTFMQGFTFCFWMFAYAALLTAVGHYVYFALIDKGYLFDKFDTMLEPLREMEEFATQLEEIDEMVSVVRGRTAIQLTVQMLMNNVYYGCLMAIPLALIVKKK